MRITQFKSLYDSEAAEHDVSWEDLVASMAAPPVFQAKADCPLVKLARFGPVRNAKGFLRNNQNVTSITGIELDYDAGVMTLSEAADRFRAVGLEALLYTSASNAPDAPRWRAFLPLSGEFGPEYREAFVERANSAVGGVCAPESSTLAQAFYVGKVATAPYDSIHVPGAFLDKATTPEARPLRFAASLDVPQWEKVDLTNVAVSGDVITLIRDGPPPNTPRHAALMTAANALARAQVPPETILRILADPDNRISEKALERRSIPEAMDWLARFTVASALERFPPLASIFPPLIGRPIDKKQLFHDAKTMTSKPTPARWLIRGILEQECFALFFGASESGKSLIVMDMAYCIASGEPFHDNDTTKGAVAYISGEGNTGLSRRLKALEVTYPKFKRDDNMLILTSRAVHFRDPDSWRELISALDAQAALVPQSLIVIDTYMRSNAGGDENSAKDAAEYVKFCDYLKDRYKCTVLLIGHTSNSNTTRIMGSNVLRNSADVEMSFRRLEQDEPKNISVLECTKMKDAERFETMYFQLTPRKLTGWFDPETKEQIVSWTYTELEAPDALPKTPTKLLFAQCLGTKPISYDKVRTAFFQLCPAANMKAKQKRWDNVLNAAISREWCKRVNDELVPSPPAMYRDGIDLKAEVAG